MPKNSSDSAARYRLAEALKKRLSYMPLEKITIKQLTDDCGLNRQTFYYHFDDIYDLLKWLFEWEAETAVHLHDVSVSWKDTMRKMLKYLSDNKRFCVSVLNSVGHRHVSRFLLDFMSTLTEKIISDCMEEYGIAPAESDREFADFFIDFYSGAAALMIERRLLDEIKLTDDQLIAYIEKIAVNNIKGYYSL
ncbi:MAG: TetR/AcrR family transcriptional regulator C-terminal domain-containing protein [Oscillospiraceae bacterium]|nr:TetR/AcrR family transcriptional regulator C-terminal domain-containing protein [Oscillospiraceae bacterium]